MSVVKSKDERPSAEEILKAYLRKLARKGGKARAAKYDTKTLSEWGKKGGRPPKRKKKEDQGTRRSI